MDRNKETALICMITLGLSHYCLLWESICEVSFLIKNSLLLKIQVQVNVNFYFWNLVDVWEAKNCSVVEKSPPMWLGQPPLQGIQAEY